MPDTFINTVNMTRPKFVKGHSDMTIRKRLRLAMLRRRGRFEFNQSGEYCRWQLKYSKPKSQGYADGSSVDYSNHIAHKTLKLDWRGRVNTDTMTLMQYGQNTGDQQLINMFQVKANNVMEGLDDDIHSDMFADGEATGRTNFPHGLETFLMDDENTAVTDIIAKPSDTYGLDSLSTVPGNYGGSWSSALGTAPNAQLANDWPDGNGGTGGSPEYDFNSPILANWGSTNWGTSTNTWEANCWRCITRVIAWLMINGGKDGTPSICSLAKNLWAGYRNHNETLRRINVPHKEAQDLGFSTNVMNQDGVAIYCEYDTPADTGYIENLNHVSVSSLFPDLYWLIHGYDNVPKGAQGFMNAVDMRTLSMLMAGGFFGNLKYKPKYVGKLYPYATS